MIHYIVFPLFDEDKQLQTIYGLGREMAAAAVAPHQVFLLKSCIITVSGLYTSCLDIGLFIIHPPRLRGDSPKLLNVAAWQSGSEILLRFPFVLGRCKAGFDCPNIWPSPIPVWQLPESLLADNLHHKQLVNTVARRRKTASIIA
jgi:hypothetical protein